MLALWRMKETADSTVHLMEASLVTWPFNILIAVLIFSLSLVYVEPFADGQMLVITICL